MSIACIFYVLVYNLEFINSSDLTVSFNFSLLTDIDQASIELDNKFSLPGMLSKPEFLNLRNDPFPKNSICCASCSFFGS